MAYAIENNLRLLHSLISTQYGNVENFGTKLRQNRYYAQQVKRFLQDVEAMDGFVEMVADEAVAAGLPYIKQLVSRRLGVRLLQWTSEIKDAQAVISKRLFEARLMEQRLKRLSRYALWLTRNRTSDGWELAVDECVEPALVRPEPLVLRPQPDVSDTYPAAFEGLHAALAKLPARENAKAPAPQEPTQLLEADGPGEPQVLDIHRAALQALVDDILATNDSVSLLQWKAARPELAEMSDEAWLMYSGLQLKGGGFAVEYKQEDELDPFPINERFYDIEVRGLPILSVA
jgi:hypothetical protein